uniref:FecR domain-containing protein n=1 Tax=Roseihalotalea indica TaxID=2867963 RepID=A0AA49GTR7_9BACT|nr:FecR domain-containing protein [Tunicatimonas sp. TK19036]
MSNHYSDIDRLISLYLSNRASESEKQELEEWLQASEANRDVFRQLKKVWATPARHEHSDELHSVRDQIWIEGTEPQPEVLLSKPRRLHVVYWSKVAATLLIFLMGAWLLSYLIQRNTTVIPETVDLVSQVNPAGQRSTHRLPDGTKVWLNAESSLEYPEKFSDTLRLVKLKGEAFFEVAKDRSKPFIVEADGTKTEALGTAFNINAYPENSSVTIALLEGKVRIEDIAHRQTAILSPGEELLATKETEHFDRRAFDYEKAFGWKESILILDGVNFVSFCRTIEKWYGVKVKVNGTPSDDWHIRARYQHEDLRHVLRDICFNKNIEFEINDKNVVLTF